MDWCMISVCRLWVGFARGVFGVNLICWLSFDFGLVTYMVWFCGWIFLMIICDWFCVVNCILVVKFLYCVMLCVVRCMGVCRVLVR